MKTQVLKFPCIVYVKKSYFTGEYSQEGYFKCNIISVSCYPNQQITFDLLVDNSYIYSNVDIGSLFHFKKGATWQFNYLKYYNYICGLNNNCEVFQYPFTEQRVYCIYDNVKYFGQYCFSIDMVDDNELFHFIKLDGGHCVLVPSHKLLLNDIEEIPKFIKNKHFASKY